MCGTKVQATRTRNISSLTRAEKGWEKSGKADGQMF